MRQLLALVALLSGLAAIGVPVDARAGHVEDAMTEFAEQSVPHDCDELRDSTVDGCAKNGRKSQKKGRKPKRKSRIIVPALQLKADRALE